MEDKSTVRWCAWYVYAVCVYVLVKHFQGHRDRQVGAAASDSILDNRRTAWRWPFGRLALNITNRLPSDGPLRIAGKPKPGPRTTNATRRFPEVPLVNEKVNKNVWRVLNKILNKVLDKVSNDRFFKNPIKKYDYYGTCQKWYKIHIGTENITNMYIFFVFFFNVSSFCVHILFCNWD